MPKSKQPRRQPGDGAAFNNANDMLEALGVRYHRPQPHQLKIGKINYYPNTGKIHIDNLSKAQSKRGLEALKALLLDQRMRLGVYVAKRDAAAKQRDREQHERDLSAAEAGDPSAALTEAARVVDTAINKALREGADTGVRDSVLPDRP